MASVATITCPRCKEEIPVEEAFSHQLSEKLQKEYEERLAESVKRIENDKNKILEEVKKKTGEGLQVEIKTLREEAAEKDKKLEESRKQELELRKARNVLEEEKKEFEVKVQRQLDEERKEIREKVETEILEKQHLKDKEKDLQIDQLKKLLEDAQRKANQGSQQAQGEVLEVDLEETLRQNFPGDEIQPIGKGVLGADVRQVVKSPRGTICGTILWESKRTKVWSGDWTSKLKADMVADKANLCAIVSEVLPEEAKNGIGVKDQVWVTSLRLVVVLSMLLRKSLLEAAKQKVISQNQQDKAQQLYQYVTGHEFQHQVEAMVSTYTEMREQVAHERVAFERIWKLREAQIQKLLLGVAGGYGSIQGKVGPAMPKVENLELEDGQEKLLE